MNIKRIAFTPCPESVCDLGAKVCVSYDMPELDEDLKALGHALSSGHESVLEHATFTFAIEGISRACSHQLVRHRIASFSQQSQRYVNMDGFHYVTPPSIADSDVRCDVQTPDGSAYVVPVGRVYTEMMFQIEEMYHDLIEMGIPEEDARYILPNACCTNIVVTMNARELRHFFSLRCCERAQWEIKEVAERMLELVREVAPALFEDAGPRCKQLGYCPEAKGCGRMPKKVA